MFQRSSGHGLRSIIESYFDLQGDRLPNEYWAVYATVDRLAANHYQDYKLKAHNHLKAHRPSSPYDELPRTGRSALTSSQVLLLWKDRQRIRPIGERLNTRAYRVEKLFCHAL
ncbi:hypothetical protein Adt_41826 [Abeliophyllum distichum]|uniref:Uncharacterized protein n=1 Tax=Abeliophyllum distichum TaxID=126358 RepID=A0ABD1PPX2_9LAMI